MRDLPASNVTSFVMQTDRGIFLALAELAQRYRRFAEPADGNEPLTAYELCCFSQHGEDGVIAEILHRIGVGVGTFVEFGIESGREGNCVFLADVLSWSGLFIEPDETHFAALQRKYASNPRVTTLPAAVTSANVQALFAQGDVAREPDVLSIDVDGPDYWIWEAIIEYRPRTVVIEYNPTVSPGRKLVQPSDRAGGWGGTDFFGASLDALVDLGGRHGYRLVHTDLSGANAFFVQHELARDRFPADAARRTEPNYFMQGYRHPADATGARYVDLDRPPDEGDPYTATTLRLRAASAPDAERLIADSRFIWHQRFELAPGVFAPGTNDVGFLLSTAGIPEQLHGETVLDIGTTNGGMAFELERRGAGAIIAVDILDADAFGFNAIRICSALKSPTSRRASTSSRRSSVSNTTSSCSSGCCITCVIRCSHSTTSAGSPGSTPTSSPRSATLSCPKWPANRWPGSTASGNSAAIPRIGSLPRSSAWRNGASRAAWSRSRPARGPPMPPAAPWSRPDSRQASPNGSASPTSNH